MPFSLHSLAYLAFHVVVWGSLFIGKVLHPSMAFPDWKKYLRTLPVSLVFILMDAIVANHWWYFSAHFTVWRVGPLPIEEIAFFFSVSYALLVVTENIQQLVLEKDQHFPVSVSSKIPLLIKILFLLSGIVVITYGWQYTGAVLFGSLLLFANHWQYKRFTYGFLFTILSTLLFNFYLTSLPIVTYNELYSSSFRLFTIPVEDFLYGLIFYTLIYRAYYLPGLKNL